jgi:hypothetical protein
MRYISPDAAFYDDAVHTLIPPDSIMLEDEQYSELLEGIAAGKSIQIIQGKPTLVDPLPAAPPSRAQVEAFRLHAYADPLTGSDRYFAEAQRMSIMGEAGWEQVRETGVARFEEIQMLYPWPNA